MTDSLKPRDAKDVENVVAWALAEGKALEVIGHGSKRSIGRAAQWDLSLDLSDLSGVTLYEPQELVLSAKAGTPIAEIEALLAANNQELAFEPMDYGPLFGAPAGRGTIGGVLAANLSGSRRFKAGAARDHFLGVSAVSGRGETFKSGGRVVKNVTGYDLCKVLAGSYGTLGVMADVTVKVLPRAETEQTLLVIGLDDAKAAQAMSAAMGSPNDVSGAAHLPGPVAARVTGAGRAVTALRVEGVAPSVAHRMGALEILLKSFGALATLDESTSRPFWKSVRDVLPFTSSSFPPPKEEGIGGFTPPSSGTPMRGIGYGEAPGRGQGSDLHPPAARPTSSFQGEVGEKVVWRISAAPARAHEVMAAIGEGDYFYDWAGGLIWLALPALLDGGAARVRGALSGNGHATLIRAPASLRASVPVFEPQMQGLAALTRRVKESFDPKGVLGPGKMYAGI
jgi:glycolate oxidase FAD binding subunit